MCVTERNKVIPDPNSKPVVSAEEAFKLLGIDRSTGYNAIRNNSFPVPIIRVGRIIRVPTAALRRLLLLDEPNEIVREEVQVPLSWDLHLEGNAKLKLVAS